MKQILSLLLAAILSVGLAMPATAATVLGEGELHGLMSGESSRVTKTVKAKRETYRVTGYSFSEPAREVFRLLNDERAAAGLPRLTWEPDLVQSAIQRALEQYVYISHDRPDGSAYHTVHKLVNGENLAGGVFDVAEVMDGWMNSPSHRANILDSDYNSVAVVCVETDKNVFWVQLFHSDRKITRAEQEALDRGETLPPVKAAASKDIIAKLEKSDENKATISDATTISAAELQAVAKWAKTGGGAAVTFKTSATGGKTMQGQLTLNPARFADRKDALSLAVYTEEAHTAALEKKFRKWYTNPLAVIKLGQVGSYGATVRIGARLDLDGLDKDKLRFYSYNETTNKVTRIEDPNYTINKNGVVFFDAKSAGVILVTDRTLTKA